MDVKIIATLGPKSEDKRTVKKMIEEGADIFRLNASHIKDEEELKEYISMIREVNKEIPIMLDLPGPKVRTKNIDPIQIERGKTYTIGNNADIDAEWSDLKGLKKGTILRISDGKIEFECIDVENGLAKIKAMNSGVILERQSINYPGISYKEGLTEKDKQFSRFAVKHNVDIVALSFVRSEKEILELRKIVKDKPIVAKIEVEEGVKNFEGICNESDAVMVARGDLALNIRDMFVLPEIQRKLIRLSKERRKPVIVATQMLASMVNNPYPTRAEITDIYNAIYEGADALMLSEETAIGKYPTRCIYTMRKIIKDYKGETLYVDARDINDKIAKAAIEIAAGEGISTLVAITRTGATAARLSVFDNKKIIAIVDSEKVLNTLKLYRNVFPILSKRNISIKEILRKEKLNKTVVVGSDKEGGTTTYIKVEYSD
ncbi:MAG: pyruvate kinase [Conexivisphaerales archaeon]